MSDTDSRTIVSGTDTLEQVQAALTPPGDSAAAAAAAGTGDAAAAAAGDGPAGDAAAGDGAAEASAAAKLLAERKNDREKRKGSIQAEINELTGLKHQTAREIAAADAQLAAKRAELAALEAGKAGAKPADGAAVVVNSAPKPKVADFTDYDDYVEALTEWKAAPLAQAAAAAAKAEIEASLQADRDRAQQANHQAHGAELDRAYKARVAEFTKTAPDFQAMIDSVSDNEAYLMPRDMVEHIYDSPNGPALAYELAQLPPDDFHKLRTLPPRQLVAELGRIEGRLLHARPAAASTTGPAASAPLKPLPAPPKPVGAGRSASAKPLDEITDFQQYKRERARAR